SKVTSSKANGIYGVGEDIYIQVYMSGPVVVQGFPELRLNAGPDAIAVYVSGGNDGMLTFLYKVFPGDESEDLDADGSHALVIPADASIQ
ncbi:unnamed protein product, partial [Sphacelaria rigidula]